MVQKSVQFPERKVLSQGGVYTYRNIRGAPRFRSLPLGPRQRPPPRPSLWGQGAHGGLGAGKSGDKGRGRRVGRAGEAANGCGRRDLRTPGPGRAPAPGEPARRWSAPGGRPGPRRPSPPARRPRRPLPRPRSLPPAPRRLRARRTWRRRRRSGGTLYLSTGPTACAGTAASSSSSAARGRGAGGARGRAGAPRAAAR